MAAIDEILLKARALENLTERAAYLTEICGDDECLRSRVEQILSKLNLAAAFLGDDPPTTDDAVSLTSESVASVELHIGRYRLIDPIGQGGFGTVYEAEQQEPVTRRVALKIIKRGMDTHEVIARFEAERQALALMEHPNIAQVYDAGETDGGRPYFVMELVKGVPITRFCDDQRLNTQERLTLFAKVCIAVQHAHLKGIIHRDLKPSNVLVTKTHGAPNPKIIDFGIAKAIDQQLTDKTLYTRADQLIGTPSYMSPEQATTGSQDIDTRSDVYSLGVILYELLTGKSPFDAKELSTLGNDEARRKIREVDPPKPSTKVSTLTEEETRSLAQCRQVEPPSKWRLLLQGDLDWVVMKALEKDRDRRYQTANALALDIQRHLGHEPVSARAPSALYQLSKFVRRNRALTFGTAAVFAALLFGVVGMSFLYVQVKKKERQANASREETRMNLYAADVNAAYHFLTNGQAGRARQLLEGHRPRPGETDLRGFEWHYFWEESQSDEIRSLTGHTNVVDTICFANFGNIMVSADWSGDVTIRSTDSLEVLSAIKVPEIATGAFHGKLCSSHDGKFLAVPLNASTRIYDITDPANPTLFKTIEGAQQVEFSQTSADLVCGGPSGVRIWNYESDEFLNVTGHRAAWPTFVGSGGQVVYLDHSDNLINVFDPENGIEVNSIDPEHGMGFREDDCKISLDGQSKLLAVFYNTGHLDLYRVGTWKLIHSFDSLGGPCNDVCFSPDGKYLAAAVWDQTIRLFDLSAFREVARLRGHLSEVWTVVFSPDGNNLMSGSRDETVRIWEAEPDQDSFEVAGRYVCFHPSDPLAMVGSVDAGVKLVDLEQRRILWSFKNETPVGFTRSGAVTAGSQSQRKVWAPPNVNDMRTLEKHAVGWDVALLQATLLDRVETVYPFEWGHVWGTTQGMVMEIQRRHGLKATGIVDAETWKTLEPFVAPPVYDHLRFRDQDGNLLSKSIALKGFPPYSGELSLSPDGNRVVGLFAEGRIGVWDSRSGDHLRWIDGPKIKWSLFTPTFSRNGQYFSAIETYSKAVLVWDLKTGAEVNRFEHKDRTAYVAFSPDEHTVATASYDSAVSLWRRSDNTRIAFYQGVEADSVAFSPDGKTLAMGGAKGRVRMLHMPTNREVGVIHTEQGGVELTKFSPNARFLAVRCPLQGGFHIRFLEVPTDE